MLYRAFEGDDTWGGLARSAVVGSPFVRALSLRVERQHFYPKRKDPNLRRAARWVKISEAEHPSDRGRLEYTSVFRTTK